MNNGSIIMDYLVGMLWIKMFIFYVKWERVIVGRYIGFIVFWDNGG